MKKREKSPLRLNRVFGLVARTEAGELLLSRSLTPLASVLSSLESNHDDQALHHRHPGIKREEISAAKAYICRFGSDAENPAPLAAGRKMLLLDENISYALLPLACRLFGTSSHVEAEGLSRQNLTKAISAQQLDTSICDFALRNEFAGILTRDTDFAAFYKDTYHPATKLNIFLLKNKNDVPAEDIMRNNYGLIDRQLNSGRPTLINL